MATQVTRRAFTLVELLVVLGIVSPLPAVQKAREAAGRNMLYCDGSVQFTSYVIDPDVFFGAGRRSE